MSTMASQITGLMIVYSTVYSDADQRKHQSSASLAFVRGIHRRPVNSPHKWPVTQKNVSIWWRHHENGQVPFNNDTLQSTNRLNISRNVLQLSSLINSNGKGNTMEVYVTRYCPATQIILHLTKKVCFLSRYVAMEWATADQNILSYTWYRGRCTKKDFSRVNAIKSGGVYMCKRNGP